tara:strand:+ start:955 stop:1845 length:891 start_codon:yes stop_codon:yes gene_type:complete
MIFIRKFSGQLGNQLLTYNNACQLAKICDTDVYCVKSDIYDYFKNVKIIDEFPQDYYQVNSIKLNKINKNELIEMSKKKDIELVEPFLGEIFYTYNVMDPRTFLEFKDEFKTELSDNYIYISIHLRMPSNSSSSSYKLFKQSVYKDIEYLKNSIKFCRNYKFDKPIKFIIYGASVSRHFYIQEERETYRTMDNFETYKQLISFFNSENIEYELCPTMIDNSLDTINDFSHLSECDIMIGNPSSFGQTAFFIGKNNKQLIYSKRWIEFAHKNSKPHDRFWSDLYKGGNEYYKVWKFI